MAGHDNLHHRGRHDQHCRPVCRHDADDLRSVLRLHHRTSVDQQHFTSASGKTSGRTWIHQRCVQLRIHLCELSVSQLSFTTVQRRLRA